MDVATIVVGGLAAAIALVELRSGLKAVRVQRVIDLHRDLTTGEVGAARDRFTTLMWKHGERHAGRNVCHAPRWEEILTNVLPGGAESRGVLGAYPPGDAIATAADAEPMRDLYSVLWCFERIEAGRAGRALDRAMLNSMLASHAVWWDEFTRHLAPDNTRHVVSLRSLARALETTELRSWARRDFVDDDARAPSGPEHRAG
jgi:hypothetical protein